MKKLRYLNIRITEEQHEELYKNAQELSNKIGYDITIASVVRKAIAFYLLEQQKKEV